MIFLFTATGCKRTTHIFFGLWILDDENDERANGIGRTRDGSSTTGLDREEGG